MVEASRFELQCLLFSGSSLANQPPGLFDSEAQKSHQMPNYSPNSPLFSILVISFHWRMASFVEAEGLHSSSHTLGGVYRKRETSIQNSSRSPQPSGLGDSTSEPIPMARGMTGMAWLRPGLSINKPTTMARGMGPCGKGDWG